MLLVLDSNEYLFAVGIIRKLSCEHLLDLIIKQYPAHRIRISRLIINEIRRNLPPEIFGELVTSIQALVLIDEDLVVPFELGTKYEFAGLKSADALIAAYTEWVGAELLVSENRHFLTRRSDLPFKVLTAEQAVKLL